MFRKRHPLLMFIFGQVSILALAGLIWGFSSTAAQRPDGPEEARRPITSYFKTFPSNANGTSTTIGTLPPRQNRHNYISVSSADFIPAEPGYNASNYGKALLNTSNPAAPQLQQYIADVNLPSNIIVTQLVLVAGDTEPDTVPGSRDTRVSLGLVQSQLDSLNLAPNPPPYSEIDLAVILSENTPQLGDLGINVATVSNPSIVTDNTKYAYILQLALPTPNTMFRSARIEYIYPNNAVLPMIYK